MVSSKMSAPILVLLVILAATRVAGEQTNVPSCASKLVLCANYLNSTQPPASCCDPLKEAVTKEPSCLCNLYENPSLLNGLGIDFIQALELSARCGISADISACNTGQAPSISPSQPPSVFFEIAGRSKTLPMKIGIATGSVAGLTAVIICIIYFLRRKTKEDKNLEAFIRKCGSLGPKRYSYSDVKKITNSFKEKLGQGGYGTVYKGKLSDGRLVAVKKLNVSEENAEEFISEVLSISKTSHVNIVMLLGFCIEGKRRALVYEYMPNGSLEKYVHGLENSQSCNQLGMDKLFQISLGVARGLDYLHQRCNTRILHFDIKPHNILLDKDFCPKISDFGLAKQYSKKESIVSILGARGTIGYIAPELVCRSFGAVSYKSDVYSYGMMILEIAGRRKNVNAGVSHTSEIYFPHWAYQHLIVHQDLRLRGAVTSEEDEIASKIILVGLWCIQNDPSQRPTMSKVMEMLEGSLNAIEIPPKAFFGFPTTPQASSNATVLAS